MNGMSLHPYPKGGLTGCQISIKHVERPGESHTALDGKKPSGNQTGGGRRGGRGGPGGEGCTNHIRIAIVQLSRV